MKSLIIFALFLVTVQALTINLALPQNQQGVQQLKKMVLQYSDIDDLMYGSSISTELINSLVATDPEIIDSVMKWLDHTGCTAKVDYITCQMDISEINSKFQVDIQKSGNKYFSLKKAVVPKDVLFVEGFFYNLPKLDKTKTNIKASSLVDSGYITRQAVMDLYGLTKTQTGQNVSVGAMEYEGGDGFKNSDLKHVQEGNGVPENIIHLDHIIGFPSTFPDTESTLDVSVMWWAASDAELWYEVAPAWMYTWAVSFYELKHKPEVVSISWGWSETDQCMIIHCNNSEVYVSRSEVEFLKVTAQRVTIVVAAGDAGAPGRMNENCDSSSNGLGGYTNMNPVFPGGSEWVLSVGATYVEASSITTDTGSTVPFCKTHTCVSGTSEAGTTFEQTGWTSGSGFNYWSDTPAWQLNQVKAYLNSSVPLPNAKYFNANGRGYPDVAAFGHNCLIYFELMGGWATVDGTSCASPVFAGVITNLNAYQKSRGKSSLGYINPLLYKMSEEAPKTFTDITTGDSAATECQSCSRDFGFLATKGWDPVGGLGTPNIDQMRLYLGSKA